jgi:hypothetical protein
MVSISDAGARRRHGNMRALDELTSPFASKFHRIVHIRNHEMIPLSNGKIRGRNMRRQTTVHERDFVKIGFQFEQSKIWKEQPRVWLLIL